MRKRCASPRATGEYAMQGSDYCRHHGGAERGRHAMSCAVIAGNYAQFADWCREKGVSPRGRDYFYATPQSLRGRRDIEIKYIGTWAQRDDLGELEQVLRFVNLVSHH